jgi:hypothetical protein
MKVLRNGWWIAWIALFAGLQATAETGPGPSKQVRELQNRVEQMAHGYVTEVEWTVLLDEIAAERDSAAKEGRSADAFEIDLLHAKAVGYLRRDWAQSLAILRNLRTEKRATPLPGMNRVYLEEAAILARIGDADAIATLIREFRASPYFDPRAYPWSGGQGPGDPLIVIRPRTGGSDSITVTAMEKFRREAQYPVGARPPDFEMEDLNGRRWTRDDLLGSVVVLDFRLAHSAADAYRAGQSVRLTKRCGSDLVILNVCLNLDGEDLRRKAAGARNETWIPRGNAAGLLKALAIFGDAQTIILDREGRIAARLRDGGALEQEVSRLFLKAY